MAQVGGEAGRGGWAGAGAPEREGETPTSGSSFSSYRGTSSDLQEWTVAASVAGRRPGRRKWSDPARGIQIWSAACCKGERGMVKRGKERRREREGNKEEHRVDLRSPAASPVSGQAWRRAQRWVAGWRKKVRQAGPGRRRGGGAFWRGGGEVRQVMRLSAVGRRSAARGLGGECGYEERQAGRGRLGPGEGRIWAPPGPGEVGRREDMWRVRVGCGRRWR